MNYIYWCFTFSILLAVLIFTRKKVYIKQKILLVAWKIALLRSLLLFKIPSHISIYNWLNHKLSKISINEDPVLQSQYFEGYTHIYSQGNSDSIKQNLVVIFYLIGVAIFIAYFVFVIIRSIAILRKAKKISDYNTNDWINNASSTRKKIHVLEYRNTQTPMSCDMLFCSYIIVPSNLNLSPQTYGIYEHELQHIKSHDTFWKILSCLSLCIHWFNPIIWLFYKYFNSQLELVCDEAVLQNCGREFRSEYARLLLSFTTDNNLRHPAFSSFKSSNIIKERVRFIMLYKDISKNFVVLSGIITVVITLCLVTNAFAVGYNRIPLTPDYTEVIYTEEEVAAIDFNSEIQVALNSVSLNSGATGEHDIRPNDRYIYSNDGTIWSLNEGQTLTIDLNIVDRNFPTGQMIEIGFLCDGINTVAFSNQIHNGVQISFTTPKQGNYLFYIDGRSSDTIMVNSLTIK